MEFNPLDLLASAAELQQKHDDPPQPMVTMVTRRRNNSATTKPSVESQHKENTEAVNNNNNNNNNIKTRGIAIIKKIKIGSSPEIEKMLNEHNYGNAKKSPRFEKNVEPGLDVNIRNQDSNTLSNGRPCSVETKPAHVITTFGRHGNKVSVITNSGSQVADSECKCGIDSNSKSPIEGKGSCPSCECGATQVGDTTDSVERTCSQCADSKCGCSSPTGDQQTTADSGDSDNTAGHTVDSPAVKHGNEDKHTDTNCTEDTHTTQPCPESQDNDNSSHTCREETQSEPSDLQSIESKVNANDLEFNKRSVHCQETRIVLSDKEETVKDIDGIKSDVVKCASVFTSDMIRNSRQETKLTTSDRKKLPYVKVIPSKSTAELGSPQTLVINITSKPHSNGNVLQSRSEQSPSLLETDRFKSEECNTSDKDSFESGTIKSLVASDSIGVSDQGSRDRIIPAASDILLIKSKSDVSKCDNLNIPEKSDSFESLKKLELSGSLCSDISSTSVHLLSPDRRNPDSMGIAESPTIMSTLPEGLSEADTDSGKTRPVLNCLTAVSSKLTLDSELCSFNSGETGKSNNSGVVSESSCSSKVEPSLPQSMEGSESSGEARELMRDSRLTSITEDKHDLTENSANDPSSGGGNDVPIFRFESDHCYAGLPRVPSCSQSSLEMEDQSCSEGEEVKTPSDSLGEVSQDSGYEDVTHSPDTGPAPDTGKAVKTVKNLVPVLISVNNTGCLTLHSDPNISKQLGGQVLTVGDGAAIDKGSIKLIPGTTLSPFPQSPLIMSPVGSKPPLTQVEPPPLVQTNAENILSLLRPTSPDICASTSQEQTSPPKFGKFRIGTFASFSNTGMGMETVKPHSLPAKLSSQSQGKLSSSIPATKRTNGVKSPPVVDTLGTLVQKVKSSLSPSLSMDNRCTDHIQHDHDYCLKSLVPSLVSSVLEAKLQKEATVKGKVPHGKIKKLDNTEQPKQEVKLGKRKRSYSNMAKEEYAEEFELDEDCDFTQQEFVRPKTRAEKYIEQKSAEPKVKITGSSTFQDQFVYFMNTKKRSRRRESRDTPIPGSVDRKFIPPKPGDIVVPHLSDQDIENLKKRSRLKQAYGLRSNSLRNEFMAAKLNNHLFAGQSTTDRQTNGYPVSSAQSSSSEPTAVVDEKNIINTILSLENESLSSPDEPYNESMELYGQGLGADILNLLPEQMNLTQEQMDLLYSAVDEVQNSSPGLVDDEKLESTGESTRSAFSQFAAASETSNADVAKDETAAGAERDIESTPTVSDMPTTGSDFKAEDDESAPSPADEAMPATPLVSQPREDLDAPSAAADSQTSTPPLDLPPTQTTPLSGKPKPATSEEQFPQVEPIPAPAPIAISSALSMPQSSETSQSLQMSTASSSMFTKASFLTVSQNDSAVNNMKTSTNSVSLVNSLSTENTVNITNSLQPEMSTLPALDKSSLDILGGEFRLDKTDLFAEPSGSTPPGPISGPVDTSAPWIVTVSMYWNDLPAIMINNQPYVRLVDIHKQILPAKDTGILKKRCQLMGITVENCSEMQRYFLVQYGRAFNSKSTLIVSKDNAKDLIGYYVDPQPKMARMDDHKSIIDHRREQLRRIALARRAAIRARRVPGRKEEDDPRAIRDETEPMGADGTLNRIVADTLIYGTSKANRVDPDETAPTGAVSSGSTLFANTSNHVTMSGVESLRPVGSLTTTVPTVTTPTDASLGQKRATRHKKINFLEMLRGDSSQAADDDATPGHEETKKTKTLRHQESTESTGSAKKGKALKNKVKVVNVKYTIQSESSETESNYSDSELSSYDSTESEIVIVKKPSKHRCVNPAETKAKSKAKLSLLKKQARPPLKVKITSGKRGKLLAGSSLSPVAVQVVNKTVSPALPFYRSRLGSSESRDSVDSPSSSHHTPGGRHTPLNKATFGNLVATQDNTDTNSDNMQNAFSNFDNNLYSKQNIPEFKKVIVEQINERDLKIPTTLPDEILEEESKTREMETNTDFDVAGPESSEEKLVDVTGESVDKDVPVTNGFHDQDGNTCVQDSNLDSNTSASISDSVDVTAPVESPVATSEGSTLSNSVEPDTNKINSQSPVVTNGPLLIMKPSEREQILSAEAPLRILHRDSSPLNIGRSRSQLGELFIDKYMTKKSPCVQCYTCRRMMSVDNFMRHLHDNITGGLIAIDTPRTIDTTNGNMSDRDRKVWEAFQRKKELFDNNQLPSPDIQDGIYGLDSDSNHSLPETVTLVKSTNGPRVITTPVSPVKKAKVQLPSRRASLPIAPEALDGVRSSGRKRKKKQLYPFEEYTFTKFPRLHGVDNRKDGASDSQH